MGLANKRKLRNAATVICRITGAYQGDACQKSNYVSCIFRQRWTFKQTRNYRFSVAFTGETGHKRRQREALSSGMARSEQSVS